jgi:hypothetical protein
VAAGYLERRSERAGCIVIMTTHIGYRGLIKLTVF